MNSKENSFLIMKVHISPQTTALETMPLISSLANSTLKAAGLVPAILPESWCLDDYRMLLSVLWQFEDKGSNARMNTKKRSRMD